MSCCQRVAKELGTPASRKLVIGTGGVRTSAYAEEGHFSGPSVSTLDRTFKHERPHFTCMEARTWPFERSALAWELCIPTEGRKLGLLAQNVHIWIGHWVRPGDSVSRTWNRICRGPVGSPVAGRGYGWARVRVLVQLARFSRGKSAWWIQMVKLSDINPSTAAKHARMLSFLLPSPGDLRGTVVLSTRHSKHEFECSPPVKLQGGYWGSRVPVRPRVNQRVTRTRATGRVRGRVRVRVGVWLPAGDPCRSLRLAQLAFSRCLQLTVSDFHMVIGTGKATRGGSRVRVDAGTGRP
ncbi:hypothetical protein C8R45DRAFT_934528 [Mycena sanguinolenta]|nr:hypothetical protein C8R45DRAFT_934528 [Mycena sanguinolenta]